jgi:acetyl esterase/lipase
MTRSEVVFRAIDILWHAPQNYRRYDNIKKEGSFVYDDAFAEDCVGDIYYDPSLLESGKKLPVVVNIHGGGFVKGDKHHRSSVSKRFAANGYIVFNINYRLSPKYSNPEATRDCIKAVNYLAKLPEKFNIDLNKVVVTGDSAGAYYATQIVAVANSEELRKKLECDESIVRPACLLSFCGPYDLVASITLTKLPFDILWDIGRCYLDNDNYNLKKDFSNINDYPLLKEMSPIEWVNKNWCPSFLVMAKQDIFCKGQGELLEKKLMEAKVPVDSFKSHKFIDNHCFHLDMFKPISKRCYKKAFEFLDKHLDIDKK